MPFYEYECQNCKFYTELMQKISDPPLEKCPSCKKKTMKKLISAPVFRLKGGGWYETDFKGDNESRRNLAGADKEEAKATDADSGAKAADTKADAKPAAAADAKAAPPVEPKRERASSGGSRSTARPATTSKGHGAAVAKSHGKAKATARTASRPAGKAKAKPKGKAKKGRR